MLFITLVKLFEAFFTFSVLNHVNFLCFRLSWTNSFIEVGSGVFPGQNRFLSYAGNSTQTTEALSMSTANGNTGWWEYRHVGGG